MTTENVLAIASVTPCRKCGKPVYASDPNTIIMCKDCWAKLPRHKPNVPEKLRWEVFERDNFTCQYCGSRRRLTIDHIKPEFLGGETTMDNLQTLCKSCNSKKWIKT